MGSRNHLLKIPQDQRNGTTPKKNSPNMGQNTSKMIRGIGVDVVEVARIQQAMRSPRFISRILTPQERKASLTPLYVAGRWAAKEAIAKAIGANLRWHDVEILNDETGKPKVHFLKRSKNSSERNLARTPQRIGNIHLAISHERGVAVAVAIWEAPPKCA